MMVIHGDCLEQMATLPAESVDSIVTDPPYGLSFMGKDWDHGVPGEAFWREALRVAKPGAHLLAFGGSRTYHRLACAIEDAGWEVRDCIMYVFGTGFPKNHDVSKAIDREAGIEREVVGTKLGMPGVSKDGSNQSRDTWRKMEGRNDRQPPTLNITAPATDAAKQWQGWGTALKPAYEPIIVARKPLVGTVAANVQQYGTGAINVDGGRVGNEQRTWKGMSPVKPAVGTFRDDSWVPKNIENSASGRWPANFIHDGSDEVVGLFPVTTSGSGVKKKASGTAAGIFHINKIDGNYLLGDSGSAARFFYTSKASKRDRDEGCEGLEERGKVFNGQSAHSAGLAPGSVEDKFTTAPARNFHPTVKPTDLMRYLCRLVTPPGGVVLDPFMGSGSTGKGAVLEGFNFIGIEQNAEYIEIAKARIAFARTQVEQEPAKVGNLQTSLFNADE